jgi:hypothetical protein
MRCVEESIIFVYVITMQKDASNEDCKQKCTFDLLLVDSTIKMLVTKFDYI